MVVNWFGKLFRYLAIIISILAGWELLVSIFDLPDFIFPSPILVLDSFKDNFSVILSNLFPTLIESTLGLLLGALLGAWFALSLTYFRWARSWFLPLLITSQALPTFAIAPLLVIWFGYGMSSKIIVVTMMIFFPIASSFYDGLQRTPQEWLDIGKVMGASSWRMLWRIKIPSALPGLASGLRLGAVFAPMGAVIGEWVGASRGLGFLILNANARMQIDFMFALLLFLVLLTLVFYFSLDLILKKLIFWR